MLPAGLWPQQQALHSPANVDDDAEMDLDFDMAVSRRSPPEIAKISQFFNKCYRVGFTAMVHVGGEATGHCLAEMCLTRVSMLFEQVTVMLCLTVIVAPFVGMFAGTMWVLVRVFGEWLWVVGCVRGKIGGVASSRLTACGVLQSTHWWSHWRTCSGSCVDVVELLR